MEITHWQHSSRLIDFHPASAGVSASGWDVHVSLSMDDSGCSRRLSLKCSVDETREFAQKLLYMAMAAERHQYSEIGRECLRSRCPECGRLVSRIYGGQIVNGNMKGKWLAWIECSTSYGHTSSLPNEYLDKKPKRVLYAEKAKGA